jgi:hypothetical protein
MLGFEGTVADIWLSANNSVDLHSEYSVLQAHDEKLSSEGLHRLGDCRLNEINSEKLVFVCVGW